MQPRCDGLIEGSQTPFTGARGQDRLGPRTGMREGAGPSGTTHSDGPRSLGAHCSVEGTRAELSPSLPSRGEVGRMRGPVTGEGSTLEGHQHTRPSALRVIRGLEEEPALCFWTDFSFFNKQTALTSLCQACSGTSGVWDPWTHTAACEVGAGGKPGTERLCACPQLPSLGEGLNCQGSSGAKPLPLGQGGEGGLNLPCCPGSCRRQRAEGGSCLFWVLGPWLSKT